MGLAPRRWPRPDAASLRQLYVEEGLTVAALAARFGVAAQTAHNWLVAAGEQSQGPGWWRASDNRWYPPETHPDYRPPPPPPPPPGPPPPPLQARPAPALTGQRLYEQLEDSGPDPRQRTNAPPRRPRSKAPKRRWIGLAVAFVVLVGVCSAIANNGVDEGEKVDTATPTTSDSTEEPIETPAAANPAPATLKVGDKARLDDGSTVQVYAYTSPVEPTNQFSRPKAGNIFVAIDVEGCAGGQAQSLGVNPTSFVLAMPDNTRITVGLIVGKEPRLSSAAQPAGTCNRGWVNFEVPDSPKPAAVLYNTFATSVRWSIP